MADKITIGYGLPKQSWLRIAENIKGIALINAAKLKQRNYNGRGQQDAEELLTDMYLAEVAIRYVAEFATDKCRIIPVEDKERETNG